jgi:hypothetical protein
MDLDCLSASIDCAARRFSERASEQAMLFKSFVSDSIPLCLLLHLIQTMLFTKLPEIYVEHCNN